MEHFWGGSLEVRIASLPSFRLVSFEKHNVGGHGRVVAESLDWKRTLRVRYLS